ncbi:EcsC protein family [Mycobacteroides abscessus subsp. abscessus]|nr:EcsC protein family [Mycobacteroides abscessus subsp. abscessus]
MAVINLRAVQLIAMTYGIEVNTPYEMMASLKVFCASILPPRLQGQAWEQLLAELENAEEAYFYEGQEELTDIAWMGQPIKQLFKGPKKKPPKQSDAKSLPSVIQEIRRPIKAEG